MTTIRQALEPKLRAKAQARLAKLVAGSAPKAVIAAQEQEIADGNLASKIGHINDYGDLEFTATENREYRRGYGVRFTITDGTQIDLIPGPYSLFLTPVK